MTLIKSFNLSVLQSNYRIGTGTAGGAHHLAQVLASRRCFSETKGSELEVGSFSDPEACVVCGIMHMAGREFFQHLLSSCDLLVHSVR